MGLSCIFPLNQSIDSRKLFLRCFLCDVQEVVSSQMVEHIDEGYLVESIKPLVWRKDSQESTRDWRVCQPYSGCKSWRWEYVANAGCRSSFCCDGSWKSTDRWWIDWPYLLAPLNFGGLRTQLSNHKWVSFEHVVQSNFIQFGENCDDPEDFGGNPFSDQVFFLGPRRSIWSFEVRWVCPRCARWFAWLIGPRGAIPTLTRTSRRLAYAAEKFS